MWAAIHTGADTTLTDAWNGAPALYLGAIPRLEKASHVLQAVSRRAFLGLPHAVNGEQEAIKISHTLRIARKIMRKSFISMNTCFR